MNMQNIKICNYMGENGLIAEEVMNDFSNYIYTISRNSYVSLKDEDIEEIVVDVVFTVWKNQEKLDINKKMSSYIAGITKNLIKKKYRDKKIIDNIDDYEEQLVSINDIELQFIEKENNKRTIELIEKLKFEDRKIFVEYYYERKHIKEISNCMNMSESKVKSKLFRIRKKLKKHLKKEGKSSNDE